MKRAACIFSASLAVFLLCSCAGIKQKKYETGFFGMFDTYAGVIAYAGSQNEFDALAEKIRARLYELHVLFDIYNDYDGVNNLKTVNDNAGIAPVEVSGEIIGLLNFAKYAFGETDGAVNEALGPVLAIWREYREAALSDPDNASPPPFALLSEAAELCGIEKITVDEANGTVFLETRGMSVDAGALAKGFAAQMIMDEIILPSGYSCLIDLGGNIAAAGGPPGKNGGFWNIGVQDPAGGGEYIKIIRITNRSAVTSGDYQRYYEAGGARYHHIVDPGTLFPADNFSSVTVLHEDSGVADMLSTALFILPLEAGGALALKHNAGALWVTKDGNTITNGEFEKYIK